MRKGQFGWRANRAQYLLTVSKKVVNCKNSVIEFRSGIEFLSSDIGKYVY